MAFDSFGNGGGKAWQTPAPAEKPESAAAAGHSLAPTMRVGGGPTDGCSSMQCLQSGKTLLSYRSWSAQDSAVHIDGVDSALAVSRKAAPNTCLVHASACVGTVDISLQNEI